MQPISIREPYWKAGNEFKWDNIYGQSGIPIQNINIKGEGYLYIQLYGKSEVWAIPKSRARAIVFRYKSYKDINGIKHCVVPWDAFQKV